MAKLYPPYIEGTLPAFCLDVSKGEGDLIIPFAHNKAIATSDVSGIAVKVKTVQNDVLITSFITKSKEDINSRYVDNEDGTGDAIFKVSNYKVSGVEDWNIAIGQYYKIQIAYIDNTQEIGYYSIVGVIKCTSTPEVTILDFNPEKVNNNRIEFVGQFKQSAGGDTTEKVYSSKFIITDLNKNVIEDSGDILHNVENNPNSYTSIDTMSFNRDLNFGEIYKITYSVVTTNGLKISSPDYLITQQRSLSTELKGKLIATLNYDEGFIDVRVEGYVDEDGIEEVGNGSFVLAREDSVNPGVWEELCRFAFKYESPTKTIFRDFTIEQGKTYTYSIQQYNARISPTIYSDRKKSNSIYANFEDLFIYDGEQQLKLRFNPQVSSFKTQMSETRSETIGSKYPFFFRNARIGYKTFPVSGLISMLLDENQFFTSFKSILKKDFSADRHDVEINRKLIPNVHSHTDLNPYNYVSERLFKLKVLDWFNNGKVKLFKSPSEGNYLVRFMDNSLTPENGLGRMIHTINSTAYEACAYTYANMVNYGIIHSTSANETTTSAYVKQWREMSVGNYKLENKDDENNLYYSDNLLKSDISNVYTTILRFIDFIPGTKIRLVFDLSGDYDAVNSEDIVIGATGNYYADDVKNIYGIYIQQDESLGEYLRSGEGSITYEYDVPARNMFDLIVSIQTDIGCYGQVVGECENIIEHFNNIREQVTQITMSNYHKRPIEFLYYPFSESLNMDSWEGQWWNGYDSDGYRILREDLPDFYWDASYNENEKFDDKESEEYSPFGLYVLKDFIFNGEDIREHLYNVYNKEYWDIDIDHQIGHMFEKYYIDRYVRSTNAEETLSNATILYQEYLKALEEENEEDAIGLKTIIEECPVYVLDAWNGSIYKVGENWLYDPTIIYNGEEIDLREIQNYSLDNLEIEDSLVSTGNGVYAEVFFQNATKTFQLETEELNKQVWDAKQVWIESQETLETMRITSGTPHQALVAQYQLVEENYSNYLTLLENAVNNWTTRLEE